MWWRGLVVWLGAATFGAVGGSILLNWMVGGGWTSSDWRVIEGFSASAGILTMAGSALLMLTFDALARTLMPSLARDVVMISTGAVAGGLLLGLIFAGSEGFTGLAGTLYGAVTATAWVCLARMTNMSRMKR